VNILSVCLYLTRQIRLMLPLLQNIFLKIIFTFIPLILKIRGMRAPFLQIGGDPMYRAMVSGGLAWEASRPTQTYRNPGLWPYTNDFDTIQDCQIAPCPTGNYPGFWTVPIVDYTDGDGFPCSMVDQCQPT
jgi:hypothetical protein